MSSITVGVDVGGTNIKFGLMAQSGRIFARTRLSTKSFMRDRNRLIGAVIDTITHLLKIHHIQKQQVLGIGLGFPGLVDFQKGFINYLPNVPGWQNVPIKQLVQKRLNIPTYVDNDVNLITLGEWQYGVGKNFKNIVCITLGTGVGGGLILNNKLYRGEGYVAGEVGHMLYNGSEFEKYVGNEQLKKRAKAIFKKDLNPEDLFALAQKGNRKAKLFWKEIGTHIGMNLVNVVNMLNPRLIIIGGGISNNFKYFAPAVKEIIKRYAMKVPAQMVKVVRARLGDDAGILGAKVLVREASVG